MSSINQPGSNASDGLATSLSRALQQHRQAVAASAQAMHKWTAATADEDRDLQARLDGIRERLSAAVCPPAPPRGTTRARTARSPILRVVGVND